MSDQDTNLAKIVTNIQLRLKNTTKSNVVCAGGIIYSQKDNKVLVVKGAEKWSLPKGHIELGEEFYETATREIYEETSLHIDLSHTSVSKKILKCIYYLISIDHIDQLSLHPIDTKEVSEVRWCTEKQLLDLNCNKQLKYLLKRWNSIITELMQRAHACKTRHIN
jgi:8-oxo-dGTP pyrophosphatase MutT (NUDIX family)